MIMTYFPLRTRRSRNSSVASTTTVVTKTVFICTVLSAVTPQGNGQSIEMTLILPCNENGQTNNLTLNYSGNNIDILSEFLANISWELAQRNGPLGSCDRLISVCELSNFNSYCNATVVPESPMTSLLNVPLSTSSDNVLSTPVTWSSPSSSVDFTRSVVTDMQSDETAMSTAEIRTFISVATTGPVTSLSSQDPASLSSSFNISSTPTTSSSIVTDVSSNIVSSVFTELEINPTAPSQSPSSTTIGMSTGVSKPSALLSEPGPSSLPSISPDTSVERAYEEFSNFQESIQSALLANEAEISAQRASEFLNFLSDILDVFSNPISPNNARSFGSQFLQLVDDIALSIFVEVGETVQLGTPNLNLTVQNIDTDAFNDLRLEHSFLLDSRSHLVSLPNTLFSNIRQPDVKIASVFYRDLSTVLATNSSQMRLGTPIVSSTLGCQNSTCTGSLSSIGDGVITTFSHNTNQLQEGVCVFWDLDGDFWSRRGCFRMEEESNETHTTCFCDHLTHFAVLFDFGVAPPLPERDVLALEILSYIGYGITFVCLIAVIVIFVSFKPLWGLRTYIHIHLCVNLLIALFITVFGMDKEKPYEKSRELCAATAVIGQYFYHVVFMWMLMEGVILYIKIVHVFSQEDKKHYIIFTLLSYGLPLVYLFLSIPLGFFRRGDVWSYGADVTDSNSTDPSHHSICWLTTSDYFLFVFVIPVLLIILINCCIFVIVMVIIAKKLRQSQDMDKVKAVRTWLRSAFSLMVILGIGWLIGLFVFHHVVYYVAVIYYGIQGILIFVLLVLLSSKVRKTIRKKLSTFVQQHSLSSDAKSSSLQRSSVFTFLFGSINASGRNSNNKSKSDNSNKKMHNGIELGTIEGMNRLTVDDSKSEEKRSNLSFQMDNTRDDKKDQEDLPPIDDKSLANTAETETLQCTVDFN